MLGCQIGRYERLMAKEEEMADAALTAEIARAHRQVAMLYRTELAILRNRRVAVVSEMLAETW